MDKLKLIIVINNWHTNKQSATITFVVSIGLNNS